ncbi:hypothetical protein GCM10027566_29170 [Arachidicoccus ginsenosidivorans]|uniref:Uncharacterized protein n=1 Tax=Arachidicoccus ginsenosidivorans TaxID=496057 RepID=A0A5B8VQ91_9BACT|nr:hypothetical protein [Arachidicoccus ginsenosidivorans]QEC72866.1 hypothetical protein FSB73_15430 [Arachidicoccus ginsenosidivorans]
MAEKKKISANASTKDLDKWLQDKLDAVNNGGMAEGHDEKTDEQDPFLQDALEGLSKFSSTKEIYRQTGRVNRALEKKTGGARKINIFEASPIFWFIVAIIIIITVIILAFVVLRMRMGQI